MLRFADYNPTDSELDYFTGYAAEEVNEYHNGGKLQSPVTYQGAKQRLAGDIINIINPPKDKMFYDMCCGSGAVSIELINRGFPASNITMVDNGGMGIFWESVSNGSFSLEEFKQHCEAVPTDLTLVQAYMQSLAKMPVADDAAYVYLLMQSASFGGKAIWEKSGRWQNASFRAYWQPHAASIRQRPAAPMPSPNSLYERVAVVVDRMHGITAIKDDIFNVPIRENSVVYVDPPYKGTTGYGFNLSLERLLSVTDEKLYISEGYPIGEKAYPITGRAKTSLSSKATNSNYDEWLSEFN